MQCKEQNPKPFRRQLGLSAWVGSLAVLSGLVLSSGISLAQSIGSPSEPLRLLPPRMPTSKEITSSSDALNWNQLPTDGLVLDPGARDMFDAADPASPFQSSSVPAERFGSKIQRGLPDIDPPLKDDFRSALVAGSTQRWEGEKEDFDLGRESGQVPDGRKSPKQRAEQHRRLVATFPKDFLLDSTDPGLFLLMSEEWVPSHEAQGTGKEGLESRSRNQRAADAVWQELRPQLLMKLQSCDSLLRKNSVYSARDEVRNGLTQLARRLDQLFVSTNPQVQKGKSAIRRSMPHESALQHALRELDECTYVPLEQIGQNLEVFLDLVPQATSNHPWAADLLFALGKTYERELEYAPKQPEVLRQQALGCYRVAFRMAPMRGYISNQLGFSCLQVGSLEEATKVLGKSLEAGPTAYSWRNLAELYRRIGAQREAHLADEQAEYLLKQAAETIPTSR